MRLRCETEPLSPFLCHTLSQISDLSTKTASQALEPIPQSTDYYLLSAEVIQDESQRQNFNVKQIYFKARQEFIEI